LFHVSLFFCLFVCYFFAEPDSHETSTHILKTSNQNTVVLYDSELFLIDIPSWKIPGRHIQNIMSFLLYERLLVIQEWIIFSGELTCLFDELDDVDEVKHERLVVCIFEV
jgi:hypothetical protein